MPTGTSPGRRPGRPRREDSPVDLDALLDAALRAFALHGYDGMSVRTLNRELGVSHNLVHQRFGSKHRLWLAAVDHGFGGLVSHLQDGVDHAGADPLQQLHTAIRRFIEFSAARPELTGIMNREGALGGERLDHIFDTYIAPATAPVGALLEHLADAGRIRRMPLRTFHVLVTSGGAAPYSLVPLAERFDPRSPFDPAEIARHATLVADVLVAGLRL